MKLERLEDLLEIDTDSQKAPDNKRLLTRIKQLVKESKKVEEDVTNLANKLDYEAISVVGPKLVRVAFDLDTKQAVVKEVSSDPRDTEKRNYMARYKASGMLEDLAKTQREKKEE